MHRTIAVTLLSFTLLLAGFAVAQQPLQHWRQSKDASLGTLQTSGVALKDSESGIPATAYADRCEGMKGDKLLYCQQCVNGAKTWTNSKGVVIACNK